MVTFNKKHVVEIIQKCLETKDIDKRTLLLQHLNNALPLEFRFELPAFITNNWINKNLYLLEEKYL